MQDFDLSISITTFTEVKELSIMSRKKIVV